MRAESLYLMAPRRLEWTPEEMSEPGPREALVRTIAGAVSVGAELPQYLGIERDGERRGYPRMTGYESVGRVLRLGAGAGADSDSGGFAIGERVVGFYGHRTHAVIPVAKLIRAPEGVSDALALLAILTCDAAKGIRKLAPLPEEPALIAGGGAIGLLALWTLRAYGVETVDVIEPEPRRRELTLRLGARVAAGLGEAGLGDRYALGIECSSRDDGFAALQELMRARGRICVLSDGNLEPLTLSPAFHAKELTVVGSSDGWDYQRHAAWFFRRVAGGAPELEALFEEQVEARELPATFERMARGGSAPVKVLVRYERADANARVTRMKM